MGVGSALSLEWASCSFSNLLVCTPLASARKQLTIIGINALIYYSPSLFETLGQDYEMQLLLSGIINCTQLVGVVTSLWTMDRFGRRPLLLVGAALMFICHLIIAVLVGKFGGRWLDYAVEGWVAVAFLFFFMFSFGATWGPVPWAMPSEIFPSSLRAKGVALSTCSNWFNNFIIVGPHFFYD
jgi:MFS family permease